MAITKTVDTRVSVDTARNLVTYEGLSTDIKPTRGVAVNSRFTELDTGNVYFYNGSEWKGYAGGADPAPPPDFTTATVQIEPSGEIVPITVYVALCRGSNSDYVYVTSGGGENLEIILYKGHANMYLIPQEGSEMQIQFVTGDISNYSNKFDVYGDGTIQIYFPTVPA